MTEASPRNAKKPTTSVTVVTNGPEARAGSTPILSNSTGNTKATSEYLPLLNHFYNRWQASL